MSSKLVPLGVTLCALACAESPSEPEPAPLCVKAIRDGEVIWSNCGGTAWDSILVGDPRRSNDAT